MELVATYLYNANDEQNIEVNFYQENEDYFLIAEDLSKCLGYSSRNSFLNSFKKIEDMQNPSYVVFSKVPYKTCKAMRCFTERGVIHLAARKSMQHFKDWVSNIFKGLRSGLMPLSPKIPSRAIKRQTEQSTDNQVIEKTVENNSSNADESILNCHRVSALANIASVQSELDKRERFTSAAITLLLCNDFNKVREKYLQEYENLI